jgi:flagellar basal-body rod protein FlgB
MFNGLDVLRLAQSFASHAGLRQQAIAQNVANADTPGYQARDVLPFDRYLDALSRGRQAPPPRPDDLIRPDTRPVTRAPDGNTVSLEHEMVRGAQVRGQHEMALGIYTSARDLLRAAMARGR